MFPVFSIPPDAAELPEQMGTKFKFWYNDPLLTLTLFKEGRPGTGDNWAEKLACELALMSGIPHAVYDLAKWRDRDGVQSPRFMPDTSRLIHGNELLGGKVTAASDDKYLHYYKQRSHTLRSVLSFLKAGRDTIYPPPPELATRIDGITSIVDIFIGYLLFDAWVANQDRHSENWGVIRSRGGTLYLAPSYDHGSSLARNITDDRRKTMMATKDKGASIEAYIARARSGFHLAGEATTKTLLAIEVFQQAWKTSPTAGRIWLDRLASIPSSSLADTINMSNVTKEFTLRLLELNRRQLLALKL
jgi:hypothetical protein